MGFYNKTIRFVFFALIMAIALLGCDATGAGSAIDTTPPTVVSTFPADLATNVTPESDITATFSEAMNSTTIDEASFTLAIDTVAVVGTVSYDGTTETATFNPTDSLVANVTYTAKILTTVSDEAGNLLEQEKVWTFMLAGPDGGPALVNLGTAADYAILAKTAVSTTGTTLVTGDIGLSPAAGSFLTGFSEEMDVSNEFSTSIYVAGSLFASTYTEPTPTNLVSAISDMETAYTAAAGLTLPDDTGLGAGEIGGLTIEPGLYKWETPVTITTDVTLFGSSTATWIFQVAGNLTVANGVHVTLSGGALPENILWQIGSNATLGTTSVFKGTLLVATDIAVGTGATVNGQLLAQTAVTLDSNAVSKP